MAITSVEYGNFDRAFEFFNEKLFNNKLSSCIITLQKKPGTTGYFSARSFISREIDQMYSDEIALNPNFFVGRSDAEILSTLVHQMVHQYQRMYGEPGRGGYHNREWASLMIERGLIPNSMEPGGGQTGDKVTHYIEPDGKFARVCSELLATDFKLGWSSDDKEPTAQEGDSSGNDRQKFTCSICQQNAWAKPSANLVCGDCYKESEPLPYMLRV